jgi:multiple sugar transport system permease protein
MIGNNPGLRFSERAFPYLLLIPALMVGGIVLIYPLINGVALSFTDYTFMKPVYNWIGLKNFIGIFTDPIFWEVFKNTLIMVFSAVGLQLGIGLGLALLLNKQFPLRGVFRSGIFFIWIMPEIVAAMLWMIILNSEFGILNFVLERLGIIDEFIMWRGRPVEAKISLIMVYAWRGTPLFMVMILAALQTVPKHILDASKIDGANSFQRFFIIVIPFIKHIIVLTCLLSTFRLFQDVTIIYNLTNGGPVYSTTNLAVHVYKTAFTTMQMSRAATVGVTWLVFLFALAVVYIRIITRGEFRK